MHKSHIVPMFIAVLTFAVACSPATDAAAPISGGPEGPESAISSETVPLVLQPESLPVVNLSVGSTVEHVSVEPVITGGDACIPLSLAATSSHFHFEVQSESGPMQFVGYRNGAEFEIRSALCPACNQGVVEIDAAELYCSECNAQFDPQSGGSLSATRGYPQGSISICVYDGYVRSPLHSLTVAYERTASGEELLYEGPDAQFPVPCSGC